MAPRPLTDDHTLISPSNPSNNTSNPSNPNNNDNGNIANKNNSSSSYSGASKNPVKAAFKIVQQNWDREVRVQACNSQDQSEWFTFRFMDVIGNGTFGIVCRAIDLTTNNVVAIKTVFQDEGHQNRELLIIKALNNENIIKLLKYYYQRNEFGEEFLSLVLEFVPTSLDRLLREVEKRPLEEIVSIDTVKYIMWQFIKALDYLHSLGICHRDIKPHNLLLNLSKKEVKLCDFGCSKRLVEGEPNIQYICARYYRAPEIVFGWAHYTCSIDMWSAGCVMAELFTGRPIFPGKNSLDQLSKIIRVLGAPTTSDLRAMGQNNGALKKAVLSHQQHQSQQQSQLQSSQSNSNIINETNSSINGINGTVNDELPTLITSNSSKSLKEILLKTNENIPNDALDLIDKLLRYDPTIRITAKDALRHSFFNDFNKTLSSLSLPFQSTILSQSISTTTTTRGIGNERESSTSMTSMNGNGNGNGNNNTNGNTNLNGNGTGDSDGGSDNFYRAAFQPS